VKEFLTTYALKIKRSGKHDIKIKESKWWNQEVCFVDLAEIHRFYSCSSHQQDSSPYHSKQGYDCQRTDVSLHSVPVEHSYYGAPGQKQMQSVTTTESADSSHSEIAGDKRIYQHLSRQCS
jgi:hypothetical protein